MSLSDRISALNPTHRALLEVLQKKQASRKKPSAAPTIPRRAEGDAWPLAIDQERLWFLFQLDPADVSYNLANAARMTGPLDVPALAGSLSEVVRRHEAWRTSFPEIEGRPVQVIAPPAPASTRTLLPVIDLSGLPEALREPEARRLAQASVRLPFDLSTGPLLRAWLVRLSSGDHHCLLAVHHIVADAYSLHIFWGELTALYRAFAAGQPSPLPELQVQYADFAVWQREQLDGEALEEHVDFWREQLADAPLALDLPVDRPRSAYGSTRGRRLPLRLSGAHSEALKALAQRERATPFMVLLALLQTLLSRHSGQETVVVASPNLNRSRRELEELLGFFLTQLVFATDLGGDPTFRELLGRVRQVAVAAYAHQDLPFGKLVEALRPERDTSRPPIAQVDLVVLEGEGSSEALDLSGLRVTPLPPPDPEASAYELTVALWDMEEGFSGYLEYSTDLFDATTAARLAEGLQALAAAALSDPDARLSALPAESDAARHLAQVEWNDTARSRRPGLLHGGFLAQAERTPEAVAVVDGEELWTYRELADRAAELADRLRVLGIGPEARVGVCLPRSGSMIASLLGILEAGAAYVPLDPTHPLERLAFLVEDSGVAAVVTTAELEGRLGLGPHPLAPSPISLPPPARRGGTYPEPFRELATEASTTSPLHLAYLIYTSGSTGRPKAVGVTHRSAAALLAWAMEQFSGELASGVLASTSISFDISVFEVFGPLACGGKVILAENALAFPEIPAAGEVELVNTVPSAMAELLRIEGLPASVRTVNLAGEPFPLRLAEALHGIPTVERVWNLYGPTEDTVYSTACRLFPGTGEPSIGRPVAGTRAWLLDPELRPVPLGARGELCLAGDGLARGYLGRPDLTAERFVPDPLTEAPGSRLYRTGDLARWRPWGEIDLLGRIDRQVKVRGFRIEPAEIEAVLAGHPDVREAAVVPRGDRLAAYVVPEGQAAVSDLRSWLAERLPAYMVPALWVILPALPLTPSGKVDRRALPDPDARAGVEGYAAPRTPREEALAAVWAEVLGVSRVGIHDNFFRLGGDSILSIQMVARARREGLAITPRQVFERQTVAELAAAAREIDAEALLPDEDGLVTGSAPLTPIQRWFLDRRPEEPWHFNQAVLLDIRGDMDEPALRRAVGAVLEHHDALRLRFAGEGMRAVFGEPPAEPPVVHIDLSALAEPLRRSALETAASQVQASFDLQHGPLLRAALFGLGPAGTRLLLVLHHLVVDGVSWRILLEDLENAGRLPAKTTSWKRWAERLAQAAGSDRFRRELGWWLALPQTPPLPVDHPGGENNEASLASAAVSISPEATRALLQEAPEAYHARTEDLLLTALARTLARWTGAPRVRLDLEGHGREEELILPGADLSRTIGWFTVLYPVVLEGADLRQVKEQLRAVPSRGLGFGLLRYLGEPEDAEQLAALPPSEVVFNYLGQLDRVLDAGGRFGPAAESPGTPRSPRSQRRYLLDINAEVREGRLTAHWAYSENLYERATIEALARGFAEELEALVAHCLSPEAGGWTPSDFPLARLDQTALDRLLGNDRSVEDLYPLAPLQEGLLFHAVYSPAGEIYFEQLTCTLRGDLDPDAFRRAWQRLVDRHGILRTAFLWEGLDEPLQVVRRNVEIPWIQEDWRRDADPDGRLETFTAADRRRSFDVSRAPLLRAALLRTGEREHRFVWSFHHLLLDGWSLPRVFGEVFALYEADPLPPPALPYRDFVAWLEGRDRKEAESWWRHELADLDTSPDLPWDRPAPPPERASDFGQEELVLAEDAAARLDALARGLGLTLNTLVQGAWGFLLARWTGEREVVFGAVVAGRPPELPGVESALGLFVNTLPVRVAVDPGGRIAGWLADLQARQAEMRQHEQTPLPDIQRWSGLSAREPLFQTLLAFESYPVGALASAVGGDLEVTDVRIVERTGYPLTLSVLPGARLRLQLTYDHRFESVTARRLLSWLDQILAAFAADPERSLGEVGVVLPAGWTGARARIQAGPAAYETPRTETERAIAAIWRDVLGVERVGLRDNFFDLGGHSLLLMRVHDRMRRELGSDLTLVDLFRHPDVASLARRLRGEASERPAAVAPAILPQQESRDIAIIGMAGRFPGAANIDELWQNLRAGIESISFFTEEEMRAAGVPEELLRNPDYVPARGIVDGADLFDAGLFDYSPREAELTDPQQRLFLECALEALENAGHDPGREGLRAGVWAGTGLSTYGIGNLFTNPDLPASARGLGLMVGNDKDFLSTRVAYKLDLRGPAMTVQTACSTSLVAVHEACRSLLAGECEMALAGGVSVHFPQKAGYLYMESGIESPDGHCRSFDARARGTVGGDGVGVVVLRPLAAALADGDFIHAVIRGSAINNDGAGKVGYTAPSVEGQARAIAEAQAAAGVDPATIQYIEAHGSATPLGDPIEVAALHQAFGPGVAGTCALGSVKSNVGHLDAAAGITGLIKTVLALKHREIPPSLHFETPNPQIDFAAGSFRVNDALAPWPRNGTPRRAGVSSFGLGGTNVHVVLEEAPEVEAAPARDDQLVVLSARTEAALERATDRLARYLENHPDESLGDIAWTLQVGRRGREHRRALVCLSVEDAARALAERDPRRLLTGLRGPEDRPVAFVFPGLGDQYPGMGAGLYRDEPVFREKLDRCAEILLPHLGRDLREVLQGEDRKPDLRRMLGRGERITGELSRTAIAQPAVFALEYALAKLWMSWGVRPQAVLGYSLGEYVAACVAGVLSLEDALLLVAERARWIDELPAGSMLAVALSEADVQPLLGESLSLAAVNGQELCVVAGPPEAVGTLESRLTARGVPCRPVETSHAFHSRMMLPVAPRLTELVQSIERQPPRIPCLSNVTGGWLTAADATDPEYWSRHLCGPVRFAEGLTELWREPDRLLLEVGPGGSLTSLALQHLATLKGLAEGDRTAVHSLPSILESLAKLWIAGVEVDWKGVHAGERRRRVPLPAYPFERRRYWIEPRRSSPVETAGFEQLPPSPGGLSLLFADGFGLVENQTILVTPGETFARTGERTWTLRPGSREDFAALFDDLTRGPFAGHARPNLRNAYVPPEGDMENTLAGMWQSLLGIEAVGRHDSFFEMGGHSLLATSLMARVRESFGVALPIAALFENPTIAELAALVARRRSEGDLGVSTGAALPVVVPDPEHRFEPFPLTDIQQAYWLGRSESFELGGVGSHIYFEFDADGLDLQRLTLALRRAIDRHEMLRAVFLPDGRQRILPEVPPYEIATIDLAGLDPTEKETALQAIRAGMSHQVLRPERWPLFEIRAARIDAQRTRLYVSLDVLIGDGWSFEILSRELVHLYREPDADLPPLELSFRDYVLAEAALQETEAWQRSLDYWQQRVQDLPPAPELPLAKAPAALDKPRFRRWSGELDAASWQRLKERGSRAGLTPSGLLLAAFSEVLATWSKSPRFTITLTLFNRLPVHPQVDEILGDFTSLTLLGVDVSGPGGFEMRARSVQERLWQDLEHRSVSGVRVLRELARVHGHHVLQPVVFTSTLNVAQEAVPSIETDGPRMEWVYGVSQTPQVWLDHQVAERDGALTFNWDVVEELFSPGLIDALWDAWRSLLHHLTEDEATWSAERLHLLPAEQLAVREQVNATAAPLPDEHLHTLFARRASAEPNRPAVLAPDRTLTYGELHDLSSRLGRHLRALGAEPNTLIAVVQEKGWEQVVSVLGILASGAAYLPLEPGLPRERLHQLLERGEVRIAVTTPALDAALDWPPGVQRVVLDDEGTGLPEDSSPLDPIQAITDLAYVIFTSGSTGQPKGVMIDHQGAVNTVLDVNRTYGIGPDDRVLALSSLSFDLSVFDIFGILAAGGAVVLPRANAQRDPAHWAERIWSERVTVWNSVPALLQMLVDFLATGGTDQGLDSPLRLALLSGDWIPLDLPGRIRALSPQTRVVSLGGATEASIWSIWYPIAEVDPAWKSIPYGRPMTNQTFHILDGRFEPRPDGVPGQLWIGGTGVAQGYWRDPDKTAASFVIHPETGERLYRTGDLGRYFPDGTIEFLGREDLQVKVQGYRIELGEIEAALAEHPSVRAAVVVALGERLGSKHLVAYVVPDQDPENLRAFLRERLPDYMVPPLFVPLAALPLGPNGKVDRRALPAPEEALALRSREHRPPQTGTEKGIARIWSEVLGVPVEQIGLDDNFYELRGDSILATQIMVRVHDVLGVRLSLPTFFEAVTVQALAEAADRARTEDESETEELARLAAQLREASPEEVERMLAEMREASPEEVESMLAEMREASPEEVERMLAELRGN